MKSQPDQYLPLHSIRFFDDFNLEEGQKNIFEDIISWKTAPPLVKTGRSTYLLVKDTDVPFEGIKIKGCGFFDVHNNTIMQPSTEDGYDAHIQHAPDGIKEIHYQIEVNEHDQPIYTIPKKRPYGAQFFENAKLEFDTTKDLFQQWNNKKETFPFYYPIGYARYKKLFYKDKPLGVTILGIPGEKETAFGNYFVGNFEDKGLRINPYIVKYWQQHLAPAGKESPDYFDLLSTLKKLSFEFGKTLSHLHKHYVDHDSHLFNAMVNLKHGNVVFFDLDHVRKVSEISAQKYFYYMLKDLEIGLVAIISNFLLNGIVEGVALFEKLNQPVDDYNLIEGFFGGYFGSDNEVARQDAKNIWNRMLTFSLNTLLKSSRKEQFHLAYDFCEKERKKSYIDAYRYLKNNVATIHKNPLTLTPEKHATIITNLFAQRLTLQQTEQTQ